MKNKAGRPIKGKEPTKVFSIRLEPKIKEFLCQKFGSVQKAFDYFLAKLTE